MWRGTFDDRFHLPPLRYLVNAIYDVPASNFEVKRSNFHTAPPKEDDRIVLFKTCDGIGGASDFHDSQSIRIACSFRWS